MLTVIVALVVVAGAVWLLAGGGRPTGAAMATAGWILVAALAVFGAVVLYLGRRRRR